jgi:hypothetical protein
MAIVCGNITVSANRRHRSARRPVFDSVPKNVLIPVPTDYELVHITGKTITGQPIDLIYPNGSALLQPISTQPGSNTLAYFVNPPDGTDK